MRPQQKAATVRKRFKSISVGSIVLSESRCHGRATVMMLLELLLLGVVVWSVIGLLPKLIVPRGGPNVADGVSIRKPVLRLISTSNGEKLWGQLGEFEIISMDLVTREARRVDGRKNRSIGNWAVSQDGAILLLSVDHSRVEIFRSQELMISEVMPEPCHLLAALSANGTTAVRVAGKTSVRLWNLSLEEPSETDFVLLDAAERIAVDAVGKMLVVAAGQKGLHIYDLNSGDRTQTLDGTGRLSKDPVFSQDGKWLAVIRAFEITLFEIPSGRIAWTAHIPGPDPFIGVSFSPDSMWLAASDVKSGIQIFKTSDGTCHRRLTSNSTLHRVAFSSSNDILYSGCTDGIIRIWSVSEGCEIDQLRLTVDPQKTVR